MFRLDEGLKVYLHREPIDFRLNINGLAVLVQKALGLDPFAACVYVFSNRRRNRVKILGWDRNGFWLLLKRLEQDRFIWPEEAAVPTFLRYDTNTSNALINLVTNHHVWAIVGTDDAIPRNHANPDADKVDYYNSAFAISPRGELE